MVCDSVGKSKYENQTFNEEGTFLIDQSLNILPLVRRVIFMAHFFLSESNKVMFFH